MRPLPSLRSAIVSLVVLALVVVPLIARAGGLAYKGSAEDLTRPEAIDIAPTDDYVFSVSGATGGSLSIWARNLSTGALTIQGTDAFEQGEIVPNPTGTPVAIDGIAEANAVAAADANPSGTHVYVTGRGNGGGVGVFKWDDAATDELTFIRAYLPTQKFCAGGSNGSAECSEDSECPGGTCVELPILGAVGLTVNPDVPVAQHVYVAARGSDSIVVFSRNATTGLLTPTSAAIVGLGSPPVELMYNPRNLTISRDGLNLYVAAQAVGGGNKDGTIVVFDRNTTTGELTFKQALRYNDPLAPPPLIQKMADPEDLVVSPDGEHLYVAAGSSNTVVIFKRAGDGTLVYLGYQDDGPLKNAQGITMSRTLPGKYVYVTSFDENAVTVFTRDASTGQLLLIDAHAHAEAPTCVGGGNDGAVCSKGSECPAGFCDLRPKLFSAKGVVLSHDEDHLYVTSLFKGSIETFANDTCGNGEVGGDEECDGGMDCAVDCTFDVCPPAPIPCRTPTAPFQASLTIKNNALKPDEKDSLQWKWKKGAATTAADYGDPTVAMGGADYVLCVYDVTGLLMSRAAPHAGTCAKGKPCWKKNFGGNPSTLKKIIYQDKLYTPVGISDLQLTPGAATKAQITVKGKGAFLRPPALPYTLPITVQLVNTETSVCWGSTFTTTTSDPTDTTKVTAKGQ